MHVGRASDSVWDLDCRTLMNGVFLIRKKGKSFAAFFFAMCSRNRFESRSCFLIDLALRFDLLLVFGKLLGASLF